MLGTAPIHYRQHMWRKGDLEWKLWPQQVPIYKGIRALSREIQHVVILCARQFGKSYLGTLLAVEDCIRNPGCTVLIVGPTKEQTTDIVHQSIRVIMEDAPEGFVRRSKSESRWYIGHSELVIGGFDINNAARKRGRSLIKIYVEEVVDSDPDQYNEAMKSDLGPALTHSKDAKMIFLTTPPKITDHPFITETIPLAQLENAYYRYTIHDNHQLDAAQYAACVKRCGGENTTEFKREYLCEIVRDESTSIIPSFRLEDHIKSVTLPKHFRPEIAIDFGGVRDKTVALLYTYDFKRNKILFIAEAAFEPNTQTIECIAGFTALEEEFYGEMQVVRWADCPGQLQVDLNDHHDYRVRLPLKDDWQAAINNAQLAFSQCEVEVDHRCRLLIATLQSGQFNKNRTDFARSVALGHCDALAAAIYGIRMCNRHNPYPTYIPDRDHMFVRNETPRDELSDMALAIQPKSFRNSFTSDSFKPKRFGAFKK